MRFYRKNVMRNLVTAIVFLALLAGSFWAGSWYKHRETAEANPSGVKSPVVNVDAKPHTVVDTDPDTSSFPLGTVRITPEKQQLIGVRVAPVERAPATRTVRLLGRVVPDEMKVYRVIAGSDGWIMRLAPVTTGSVVKTDELLATFYSFELMTGIQAYVNSVETVSRYGRGNRDASKQGRFAAGNYDNYRNSLRNLGISEHQLDELDETRTAPAEIEIRSPGPGLVITRNVSNEQRFKKGDELYQIADLSQVWVLAELFGNEAHLVKPGLPVRVTLPDQGQTFSGRVSRVKPVFDAATRTLKVRLEVQNPGYVLRPDMFVDVEMPVEMPPALAVPVDAVLDSGLRKTVFVDRGNGSFEPRQVETGWRTGNRVEITKGLEPGEKIAVSGTFLIDSESRMELAAAGMFDTLSKDPVCGMDVSPSKAEKAGRRSDFQGKSYYFCSDECKEQFEKEPKRYVKE
jgi:membrane fusion protein, copper/silver efflux system